MFTTDLFDNASLISYNIKIWSGRVRNNAEDFDSSIRNILPPEDLSTLGSTALVDPSLLKPLQNIRVKVDKYLTNQGIKFFNAYLIPNSRLAKINIELSNLGDEFTKIKDDLVNNFSGYNSSWAKQYPSFEDKILTAGQAILPSLSSRFGYGYQVYGIINSSQDQLDSPYNNTDKLIAELPNDLIEEANVLIAEYKEKVDKAKRPGASYQSLMRKLETMALLEPAIFTLMDSVEQPAQSSSPSPRKDSNPLDEIASMF